MRFLSGLVTGLALASSVAMASHGAFGVLASVDASRAEVAELQRLAAQVPHDPLRRTLRARLANIDTHLVAIAQQAASRPARPPGDGWGQPGWGPGGGHPGGGPGWAPAVTSEGEMGALLRALDDAPFDDEKRALVRSIAVGRWFTTSQVIRFVDAVPFADTQVEVAATLFPQVVDPQNWYQVYAEIPFSSSREELRRRTR